MSDLIEAYFLPGVMVLVVLLALALPVLMVMEAREWNEFSRAHHCKIVGRVSGDVIVTPIVGGNGGVGISSTPDKTGYACDDGVTYWR